MALSFNYFAVAALTLACLSPTGFCIKCHYYQGGDEGSQHNVVIGDSVVNCTATTKYCFKAVGKGSGLAAIFEGCDADPKYGHPVGAAPGYYERKCARDGHVSIPVTPADKLHGFSSLDLYCCSDKDACNGADRFTVGLGLGTVLVTFLLGKTDR
ncbi:hypothetical protein AAVH_27692 [Aphelenchoides avenae]|nr:hypothetical protein AAVH_27692 [Aphelenchus avenae]